ncbi:MAG: type II toxin-antitoxin system VapC family toxin [Fimbriimonadales bacterium]|nr:type II toxin-antitoxin system VapC family toxin [Fimbriimonadales bacterium]
MSTEKAASPSSGVLLDTSVLIPLLRGDADLLQNLTRFERVSIGAPVLAETLYGLEVRNRPIRQLQRLEELLSIAPVLACTDATARVYVEIEIHLRQQGAPIPVNDVWIAALAIQYDLVLATRDRHFERVPNLRVEFW